MRFNTLAAFVATLLVAFADQSQAAACTCGIGTLTATYNSSQISNAITTARNGTHGNYPHVYRNGERIPFPQCQGVTLYEYPVIAGASPYTGGRPGADRVIYNGNGGFCGCITHKGAVGGLFVPCIWST